MDKPCAEHGAATIEYALLIAAASMAVVVSLLAVGVAVKETYGYITDNLISMDGGGDRGGGDGGGHTPGTGGPIADVANKPTATPRPTVELDVDNRSKLEPPTPTPEIPRETPTPRPNPPDCSALKFEKVAVEDNSLRVRIHNEANHDQTLTNVTVFWQANTQQAAGMYLNQICIQKNTDRSPCANFWGGSARNYGIGGAREQNGVFNAQNSAGFKGPATVRGDNTTYFNFSWRNLPKKQDLSDLGYGPHSFNGSTFYFDGGCTLVINERRGDDSEDHRDKDKDDEKDDNDHGSDSDNRQRDKADDDSDKKEDKVDKNANDHDDENEKDKKNGEKDDDNIEKSDDDKDRDRDKDSDHDKDEDKDKPAGREKEKDRDKD